MWSCFRNSGRILLWRIWLSKGFNLYHHTSNCRKVSIAGYLNTPHQLEMWVTLQDSVWWTRKLWKVRINGLFRGIFLQKLIWPLHSSPTKDQIYVEQNVAHYEHGEACVCTLNLYGLNSYFNYLDLDFSHSFKFNEKSLLPGPSFPSILLRHAAISLWLIWFSSCFIYPINNRVTQRQLRNKERTRK